MPYNKKEALKSGKQGWKSDSSKAQAKLKQSSSKPSSKNQPPVHTIPVYTNLDQQPSQNPLDSSKSEKEKGSLTGPQKEKEKSALDSASSSPHGDGCSEPNGFDEFWREYPRKVGKQAARKAWKKRRPGTQLAETIVEAIQAQVGKGHFQGNDGQQYIPNPATWLNQERWEDEIVPSVEEKRKRKWEEISKKVSQESEP